MENNAAQIQILRLCYKECYYLPIILPHEKNHNAFHAFCLLLHIAFIR